MKKFLTIITSVILSIMSYADIAYDSSNDPIYGGTWTPFCSHKMVEMDLMLGCSEETGGQVKVVYI